MKRFEYKKREQVRECVVKTLAECSGIEEEKITDALEIVSDLGLDSLDTMDFASIVEGRMGIKIGYDEVHDLMGMTVGGVVARIENLYDEASIDVK